MPDFRECKSCGYGRGFHVYFTEKENGHKIGLICPSCGQSFDIGWVTPDVSDEVEMGAIYESHT